MRKKLISWFMALIMLISMLPITAFAESSVPFTVKADGTVINVELSDETYTHVNSWDNTTGATVQVYIASVPAGTDEVTLDFGSEKVLVYGYDENGGYHYGSYSTEDSQIGETTAVVSKGYYKYFAEVQTPYIVNGDVWSNELLYAIAFDVEIPFTAEADDEEITVELSGDDYTEILYGGAVGATVDLYTITVPSDIEKIVLDFGTEEVTAYGYDSNHGFVAAYAPNGGYEDNATKGETTAVLNKGSFAEYVRIQSPYIAGTWEYELLYAIRVTGYAVEMPDEPEKEISVEKLLENISKSYEDVSAEWQVMDMAAYEDLNSSGSKTSAEAKQKYINSAIEAVTAERTGDTTLAKVIITLTALGIDAEELYQLNSTTAVNTIEKLNSASHSSSAWSAPYILAAYNQNDYEGADTYEQALIEELLANQKADGSWEEYNSPVQTTANAVVGLSFYKEDAKVAAALEKAMEYLSTAQNDDGSFTDNGSTNSNVAAMVVIALAANGINPDTNEDFVKSDVSALDALLSFALSDNSGFGYSDNTSITSGSTEQSFRALIAAKQVMETGEAFNIYDFSHNRGSLVAGYAEEIEEDTPVVTPGGEKDTINVTVTIKAGNSYWMISKEVEVDKNSTVYDAFVKALLDSGISQYGAENGYVEYMIKNGKKYGEFTEGVNSGWIYKVNDYKPDVGLKDYDIGNGDEILWYFTENYKTDPVVNGGTSLAVMNYLAALNVDNIIDALGEITLDSADAIKAAREAYDALTDVQKALVKNYDELLAAEEKLKELIAALEVVVLPAVEEIFTDVRLESYFYEAVQWALANGITAGETETLFGTGNSCTRSQIVTFLWRMMGSPVPSGSSMMFEDVSEDSYAFDAVLWAAENGITSGISEAEFGAETPVSRAQAVTFMWRMAGMPESESEEVFEDVSKDEYYYNAVLWAAENGITSGTGENTFSPDAPCLREQIVSFLFRCFGEED